VVPLTGGDQMVKSTVPLAARLISHAIPRALFVPLERCREKRRWRGALMPRGWPR